MVWDVRLNTKARKNLQRLPAKIEKIFQALLAELKIYGPNRRDWPNYGKLSENCYHCHLKKGNPTYVAVWKVISKKDEIIEVTYIGTHEKAHYDQLC